MLDRDCNGNPISTFPPCYAFQMIFTALASMPIQSICHNVHSKNRALKQLCSETCLSSSTTSVRHIWVPALLQWDMSESLHYCSEKYISPRNTAVRQVSVPARLKWGMSQSYIWIPLLNSLQALEIYFYNDDKGCPTPKRFISPSTQNQFGISPWLLWSRLNFFQLTLSLLY